MLSRFSAQNALSLDGGWQEEKNAQLFGKRIFQFWIYVKKRHVLKFCTNGITPVPDIPDSGPRDPQIKRKEARALLYPA